MPDLSRPFDVLVVGGANAALCAAITAREAGGSVLVLESAPSRPEQRAPESENLRVALNTGPGNRA